MGLEQLNRGDAIYVQYDLEWNKGLTIQILFRLVKVGMALSVSGVHQ